MQLHNFFDLIVNMFRAWASNPAADSTAISPREHRGYLATWLEKDLRFFSLLVLPKNWMARIGCSKLYDTIIHLLFFLESERDATKVIFYKSRGEIILWNRMWDLGLFRSVWQFRVHECLVLLRTILSTAQTVCHVIFFGTALSLRSD